MSTRLVREWFKAELLAISDSFPVDDPMRAPFVETSNKSPDPATMPKQWTGLQFDVATASAVSIGQPGCKRELGAAQIVIACAAGKESDTPSLTIAEMIADRLRERAANLSLNPRIDLHTQVPQPPVTPDDADGRWFFVVLGVPYHSDSYV